MKKVYLWNYLEQDMLEYAKDMILKNKVFNGYIVEYPKKGCDLHQVYMPKKSSKIINITNEGTKKSVKQYTRSKTL